MDIQNHTMGLCYSEAKISPHPVKKGCTEYVQTLVQCYVPPIAVAVHPHAHNRYSDDMAPSPPLVRVRRGSYRYSAGLADKHFEFSKRDILQHLTSASSPHSK